MKKTLLAFALLTSSAAIAQDYELWGMTQQEGIGNNGTIYKTDSIGENHMVVHNFTDGSKPAGSLLLASNDMLYGMTALGGANSTGIVFKYDPATSTFTKLTDLGTTLGEGPRGSFIQASNGMLYGTTYAGGTYDEGTIIEVDPTTGNVTKRHDFGEAASDPGLPLSGELIEVAPGVLYGTTRFGGTSDDGTIYKYELTTHTVTKLYDLNASTTGAEPFNSLVNASNGFLYGMTYAGGSGSWGTIFAYDIDEDTLGVEVDFSVSYDVGGIPQGALFEASNGIMYGTTSTGPGHLFAFDQFTSDTFAIQSLGDTRGTLMQAPNGKLYGLTYGGTIYEYNIPTGDFTLRENVGNYALYGHLIAVPLSITTAINEEAVSMEVSVYPNPASDQLFIGADDVEFVEVFAIDGTRVLQSNVKELRIEHLVPGVYSVNVRTKSGFGTTRFVKQ